MGSGKGQARRTQVVYQTQPALTVPCDQDKWLKFVQESGLTGVKVYKYYLGEKAKKTYTDAEHGKVLAELFADAVAVGAVALPKPSTLADFEFLVDSSSQNPRMNIRLKRKPDLFSTWADPAFFLAPSNTMDHENTPYSLTQIARAIESLLKEEQAEQQRQWEEMMKKHRKQPWEEQKGWKGGNIPGRWQPRGPGEGKYSNSSPPRGPRKGDHSN